MMSPEQKQPGKKILFVVLYAALLLALVWISNFGKVTGWIQGVLMLFRPIVWGLVLAYLLNPFFRFYERKLLYRLQPNGLRRVLSLVLTYLTLLLIIALLVALILPQLYSSITGFLENYDSYIGSFVNHFNHVLEQMNEFLDKAGIEQNLIHPLREEDMKISVIFLNIDKIMKWVQGLFVGDGSFSIMNTIGGVFSGITDMLFAFFISLYLLSTKEQRYAQIMKIRRALFSDRINAILTRICSATDRSFGGFIEGKLFDSLIIGGLTYVVVEIFGIPYPILVAAIVGITNIIPFVGPIIGAIPTSIIILLTDPGKVIPFLIIVVIIQQIDGNIIGPKILGNNTGVSSLCVLIAITVMGSVWGFTGMILGVPLFAVVIDLMTEHMNDKLRAKGLSSTTENYYPGDSPIDPARDVRGGTDNLVKHFEQKVLRLQKKQECGETWQRSEKALMSLYRLCRKLHIMHELSDEILTQFTAEEAAYAAEEEVRRLIRKEHGTDLLER